VTRARFVTALAAVVFLGCSAVIATSIARRTRPAAQCASLGNAASFVAFSDGAFNSSQSSGTSITGRIAAASDVTLDGVTVNPAAGDSAPTVIAGGNFVAGNTGHGGTLNGGVRYAGTIDVAQNFTVNGARTHAPPPFSFVSEFAALTESSHAWAKIAQTPGATVTLDPNSHALQLTGTDSGLNVFAVSAADLQAAAGIVIDLKKSGATALINVTAATQLSLAPQYMNLSGNASDRTLMWNLPFATGLAVTHGVAWKGVILAPTATITGVNHPQLNGQLIGRTIPTSDWVLNYVPFSGCLPPGLASPSLSSTASAPVRLGPGSSISDVAHLSGGVTPTGTITFKLHGPNDQDCTGSAVFSSTSTAAGNGYFGSGSFTPERTGTYRWVVDYSGDQNNRPAGPTACDDSNETVEVSRADTSLSSDVPHAVEPAGTEIHDTATLTGAVSPVGALTFKLYGPDDAACASAPIFSATIVFTGGGQHNSPGFTPPMAGTYRWVVSYSGDRNNEPAGPTRCGEASETVALTKAQPAISTEASPETTLGGQIGDSATLTDGSHPTGEIRFDAYGPDDPNCGGQPAHTSVVNVSNGNDTYNSDRFTPTSTGTYRWVATYSGDGNNHAAATNCGELGEDVVVSRPPPAHPNLDSTASPGAPAGHLVHDTAHLSGGSDPTGTISFRVYGPLNRSCHPPLAGFSVVKVSSGNGDYGSRPFRPRAAGVYHWVVRYSGDDNNEPAGPTACRAASETVVVSRAPTAVRTVASHAGSIGDSIHDTAVLAGGSRPRGRIIFRLYGPDDATCSRQPAFVTQQRIFGNGVYRSPTFSPQDAGTYRWTAQYPGNLSNRGSATGCGDRGETATVVRRQPALSTSASPVGSFGKGPRVRAAGLSIYDAATLTAGATPTGEITFVLYGPNDRACSRPVFTTATAIAGNGTYNSEPFTPTASGSYRWVAVYSGDANNLAAGPTGCGDSAEAVRVIIPAVTALTSSASAAVTIGGAIHDTAHLSGGSRPTGRISFRLYGPANNGCTGRPVFAATVKVAGNDDYASPSFTPTAAGRYQWVAAYSGDARNNAARPTACDDAAETAIVRQAAVDPVATAFSTTASPSPQLGAPVYDVAHLRGGVDPGGTITFELFGPDDQSCAGPPAFTATVLANGNGDYRSAVFIVPQPGTYRWVASYSGDIGNAAAGPTACNDSAESAVVGPDPGANPDRGPNHGPNIPSRRPKPPHRPKPPPPPASPPPGLG
jgi:choice-of-anchor A domain-containing protein